MTGIVVCGVRGRMGHTVLRLAHERADITIVGGIDRSRRAGEAEDAGMPVVAVEHAADLITTADVVIDFSSPAATRQLLERCSEALAGRALVVGTTGLGADAERLLDEVSLRSAVLAAANFSVGVNVLLGVAEHIAAVLEAPDYDAEIVEAHHRRKTDAPSGTAIALAEAVARGRGVSLSANRRDGRSGETGARSTGEIGLHAVRGGGTVGEHRLIFAGERESIEVAHVALDRSLFADGALRAALWVAGRAPGRYTMRQVLGL